MTLASTNVFQPMGHGNSLSAFRGMEQAYGCPITTMDPKALCRINEIHSHPSGVIPNVSGITTVLQCCQAAVRLFTNINV